MENVEPYESATNSLSQAGNCVEHHSKPSTPEFENEAFIVIASAQNLISSSFMKENSTWSLLVE